MSERKRIGVGLRWGTLIPIKRPTHGSKTLGHSIYGGLRGCASVYRWNSGIDNFLSKLCWFVSLYCYPCKLIHRKLSFLRLAPSLRNPKRRKGRKQRCERHKQSDTTLARSALNECSTTDLFSGTVHLPARSRCAAYPSSATRSLATTSLERNAVEK